jgi:hypothetical protein
MNYIYLETNSLVTIVGRNSDNKINWDRLGTNADLINLNTVKVCKTRADSNVMAYLLPIDNRKNAESFKEYAFEKYDIEVLILDETEAKELNLNMMGSE